MSVWSIGNLDEFFAYQEGKYKPLLLLVHHFIIQVLSPEVRFKWKSPHYYHKGHLAYLTFDLKSDGVYVGFVKGFELADEAGFLNTEGGTTQIKKFAISSAADFYKRQDVLRHYLIEAAMLNETSAAEQGLVNKRKA